MWQRGRVVDSILYFIEYDGNGQRVVSEREVIDSVAFWEIALLVISGIGIHIHVLALS